MTRSAVFDHYEQIILPAIAADPRAAFPEFGFVQRGAKWVASGPRGELGPLGVRHDRVAIVRMGGAVPSSFAVVGDRAVPFTCYVTGRTSPPTGEDFRAAVAELARRAGVDPGPAEGGEPLPKAELDEIRRRAEAQHRRAEQAERERRQRRRKRARELWQAAEPGHPHALAYFRGRGLEALEAVPESLRVLERCYHEDERRELPAIVAAVAVGQQLLAVHRIFLDPDDPSRKAPIDKAKKLLGSPECEAGHGAVRLGGMTASGTLVLAEGIETALACQLASGLPAWACISAGGLERVAIDPGVVQSGVLRRVVIAADNDEAKGGRPPRGQEAAHNAAERLRSMGLAVGVWIAGQEVQQ